MIKLREDNFAPSPSPAHRRMFPIQRRIDAEHHNLAVDHELLHAVLARRFDDPRIAVGPIVAAARDQAHAVAVALKAEAIAVMFDRKSSRLCP